MSDSPKISQVNLLDLILVLARNKWSIIKIVVVCTIFALIVSLIWPQTYKSTAKFLPPISQTSLGGGLSSLVGNLLPIGMGNNKLSSESILAVLHSRSLQTELINHFNLWEVYGQDEIDFLLKEVGNKTRIESTREGGFGFSPLVSVEISYVDKNPELAFNIVSFYLHKLDSTVTVLNRMNASESFEMLNYRYTQNLSDLELAERTFTDFQQKYGIFEIEEQGKAIIENLARIKSQAIELDIQISVLKQELSENAPQLRTLLRTRDELNRHYDQLMRRSETDDQSFSVLHPLGDLPELGLQYMRLYRELVIQNKIFEMLTPQYEYQKLMLDDQSRIIQVIDEPNLPTYKDSPKRALIVLAGMFFGIFLALFLVFAREMRDSGKRTGSKEYQKFLAIKDEFRLKRS